jgi:4-diphosphocytidyl-2-C-methyl-D-erythritol kinase
MRTLQTPAPAKLNLLLRVGARRPDGFHEVESLVAQISLADRVAVRERSDSRIHLDCDDATIPAGATNLAWRAAELLRTRFAIARGADIRLKKCIPAGAGLGGGSSDAAATLRLLRELWDLRLDDAELAELAAELGSDVPLFLGPPLAVLRGRGERVEPLDFALRGFAVLVLPPLQCATAAVYAALPLPDLRPQHPGVNDLLAHLENARPTGGASLEALSARLYNDLTEPALRIEPRLRTLLTQVEELSARPVHMSGSGAALFTLHDDRRDAADLAARVGRVLQIRTAVVELPGRAADP